MYEFLEVAEKLTKIELVLAQNLENRSLEAFPLIFSRFPSNQTKETKREKERAREIST